MQQVHDIGSKELKSGKRLWVAIERRRLDGTVQWIGWIEDDGPVAWCNDGEKVYTKDGWYDDIRREPREFWINVYKNHSMAHGSEQAAQSHASSGLVERIHVKEFTK